MPIITIFNGTFCGEEEVVHEILKTTGYRLVTDEDIVAEAVEVSAMPDNKIRNAFSSKTSVFNKFTHEKERAMAWIRLSLARMLSEDQLMIQGFCEQMIPKEITHVLRICLIADMKYRVALATESGLSEKEAIHIIRNQDEDRALWIHTLYQLKDPWDSSLYDIVIPTDKMNVEETVSLIGANLRSEVIKPTDASKKAAEDFLLAAKVDVALAKEGHSMEVRARDGSVTLTINKHVLMLSRLEEELKAIAEKVPGVKSVETRVGKGYYKTDIYRKYDFELPKLLLVDDEREFVQTLSERLLIRDMGSAVAFDGESALDIVNEDEPEVMILDLKMPGIDGIEVLRQVKEKRPEIEVIILTGHGSENDRRTCLELGAFAYLQKPVDIDLLSETLKKAKEKMKLQMKKYT
jgi:two-component system, OmpR family, response regulator CpxR